MGRPTPNDPDCVRGLVAGTFTATGSSPDLQANGGMNVTISGTFVATLRLRRSFDGGTTWFVVWTPDGQTERTHTAPISYWTFEPEEGVLYDLECSAFTSGTVNYRLSH